MRDTHYRELLLLDDDRRFDERQAMLDALNAPVDPDELVDLDPDTLTPTRAQIKRDREAREAADLKARPYEVLLAFQGGASEYGWGRFANLNRAKSAGESALYPKNLDDRPYGRVCRRYRVVNHNDGGKTVATGVAPVRKVAAAREGQAA